jgi:hypothetical protein
MAIYCSYCEKELPDDASFRMKCGKPLKGGIVSPQTTSMQWEYKDLVIRLNDIKVRGNREEEKRAIAHMNNLIVENLRHEGQDGWQAEDPPISAHFMIAMPWIMRITTDSSILAILGISINLYVSVLKSLLTEVVLPSIYVSAFLKHLENREEKTRLLK